MLFLLFCRIIINAAGSHHPSMSAYLASDHHTIPLHVPKPGLDGRCGTLSVLPQDGEKRMYVIACNTLLLYIL